MNGYVSESTARRRGMNDVEWLDYKSHVKCNWLECAGGIGLAGNGNCSFRGQWDNEECPLFITYDDFERQHTDDINRELAEALGMCWHTDIWNDECNRYQCKKCGKFLTTEKIWNPNFSTPSGIVLLLKKMREREDWPKFIKHYGSLTRWDEDLAGTEKVDMIPIDHILTPGLLAEKAVEWFKQANKNTNK